MIRAITGLAVAAAVATGGSATGCQPTTTFPDAHTTHSSTTPKHHAVPPSSEQPKPAKTTQRQAAACDPGWVCGVCPDGTEWGYLNDPKYANDPKLSKLFFDNKHPCG